MSAADKVNRFDAWLLDRVFQPVVDRLPEKPSGFDIGLSMQLGAVVLDAACLVAMVATGRIGFAGMIWNAMTWVFAVFFYIAILRMRPLVRPGHANPLRFMLQGLRPLAIPFAIYSFWLVVHAPVVLMLAMEFNALANLVYLLGLYLISCQPRPPAYKRTVDIWSRGVSRSGL
ncbi:hypothetical protein NFI95_00455 [Acetobacteraceae bacterium KSS8]|uniref:Amino acid permease n=1 Tax=Endosaccharibacter trunci TaxID=2812733 RepID=A0ABT1W221_9PROT|nr:hypothetical protein [Acetobacteraceae bacterium KSS8]